MSSNVDRAVPLGSSSDADARPSDIIAELIAARLGCDVRALSDDAEPLKLGLDSLGMMSVINQARRLGISATFEQLAERPTFGAWRRLLDAPRTEPEAVDPAPPVSPGEPFDLALMQHAYWAGRDADMEFGGVATHLYNEFDAPASTRANSTEPCG
ncbi:phosphopantetheine-binding protein [Corynebacterium sp. NML180780]|uniref:phosphopantetheine-binding protein n=1 Tax=Corynebacterium sp. NML180780 TaxID=2598459 RepID=UPI0016484DBC|nr:phosphopantetheine-binding protein [Corynebacterium sp. NML180780]